MHDAYNEAMAIGIHAGSKLHFVPHVPCPSLAHVVDFGCGDGSLLKVLGHLCPGALLEGVDNSAYQRLLASVKCPTARIVGTLMETKPVIRQPSMLVMSSVLHEVPDPYSLWRGVEALGFDYIAVRDFGVSKDFLLEETPAEWLEAVELDEVYMAQLQEVDSRFGPVATKYHFIHFLLKYPWIKDWEQEMREDYLGLPGEDLVDLCTSGGYEVLTKRETVTPFFVRHCRKDFRIYVDFNTHIEMVLRAR